MSTIKEMECWNNAKWCHLAVNWTPATAPGFCLVGPCAASYTYSVPCLCSNFLLYRMPFFPNLDFFIFFSLPPVWLKRQGEWIGFNSRCLDGLPTQFFKTHFTDTTGAIKDPQRNISIEECLYFALIVHLLWQTSKRGIPALSNSIYRGTRCCDETGWLSCASSPLRMGRNLCGLQNNIIK